MLQLFVCSSSFCCHLFSFAVLFSGFFFKFCNVIIIIRFIMQKKQQNQNQPMPSVLFLLLFEQQEWHPACKNFCFKTTRDAS